MIAKNFEAMLGGKKKSCAPYGKAKEVSLACFEDGKAPKSTSLRGKILRFPMFDM